MRPFFMIFNRVLTVEASKISLCFATAQRAVAKQDHVGKQNTNIKRE